MRISIGTEAFEKRAPGLFLLRQPVLLETNCVHCQGLLKRNLSIAYTACDCLTRGFIFSVYHLGQLSYCSRVYSESVTTVLLKRAF